jgi:putative transposase
MPRRPRITPHPLYLAIDWNDADRQTAYRALFRSELDEEVLGDIRLALAPGQPLGHGRFSDKICAAAGVRHTQKRSGRPAGKSDQQDSIETQTDFGF